MGRTALHLAGTVVCTTLYVGIAALVAWLFDVDMFDVLVCMVVVGVAALQTQTAYRG